MGFNMKNKFGSLADLMLEGSEVIHRLHAENQELKKQVEDLKEKLLEEQWKNADADI
jgi:hypothetical protein